MCTAITLRTQQGETFFGRNMDFSYEIQPQLFIVPGGYVWNNVLDMSTFRDIYSFIIALGCGRPKWRMCRY